MVEKYREQQKELYIVFIDLEKTYDRIPRQERCLRERKAPGKTCKIAKVTLFLTC